VVAAKTCSGSSLEGIFNHVKALVLPKPLATVIALASAGRSLRRRREPLVSRT
jgi:hypothetical protein